MSWRERGVEAAALHPQRERVLEQMEPPHEQQLVELRPLTCAKLARQLELAGLGPARLVHQRLRRPGEQNGIAVLRPHERELLVSASPGALPCVLFERHSS